MTRNSRLNSLSATKNERLLFKVVKMNWTHNNRPFLDKQNVTYRISSYFFYFFTIIYDSEHQAEPKL